MVSVILLLLLIGGGSAALVAVFLSSEPKGGNGSATPSSEAAIGLSLDDKGTSVAVTWTDPSAGKASFVVSYGRADGPTNKTQPVSAGTTTVTIDQLDPSQDYCFTVAGEPGSGLEPSPAICTKRAGPDANASPRPSGT